MNKEVVKDVRTAVQLEQELQISYAQRGVAVLDIYSAEWGPCKAITESFKRLATDQGDGVHLRFLSVECHAVLASLKHPEEQRNPQRPKNIDAVRDTLPEGWQAILQERAGQSKPYFLFYKEGKKAGFVEGVQTPQIREVVKDLCTVKTPASEFITNPRLQEFWDECFNPEESDVPLEKFFKGLLAACKYTVFFSDAEKNTLIDVMGIKDNKDKNVVTAEGLQKWIGDDEVKTVPVLVAEALPEYEARAASVVQREAEERKVEEAQRARQAEEEAARLAAQKIAQEEAAKAAAKPAEDSLEELMKNVPELATTSDALEGEHEQAVRAAIDNVDLNVASMTSKFALLSSDVAAERAQSLLEIVKEAKTLSQWLVEKKSVVLANAARSSADGKLSSNQSSLGKLASLLVCADAEVSSMVTGEASNPREAFASGDLFSAFPSVGASLCCTAAVDAPAVVSFAADRDSIEGADALAEGGSFVIPPLTVVNSGSVEGSFKLILHGLPHAISLGGSAEVFATHWFATFTITSITDSEVCGQFAEYVSQDAFDSAATNFSTQTHQDEKKLQTLEKIQARVAQGEVVPERVAQPPQDSVAGDDANEAGEVTPSAPVEEAQDAPAQEAPAEAPAEEAPAEEPAQEAPAEEAPAEEAPADKPAEEAPAEEAPAEEPAQEAPAQDAPAEEPAQEAPAVEAPADEPVQEAPAEEAPATENEAVPADANAEADENAEAGAAPPAE